MDSNSKQSMHDGLLHKHMLSLLWHCEAQHCHQMAVILTERYAYRIDDDHTLS